MDSTGLLRANRWTVGPQSGTSWSSPKLPRRSEGEDEIKRVKEIKEKMEASSILDFRDIGPMSSKCRRTSAGLLSWSPEVSYVGGLPQ
jgi:hypothetical protein